MIITDRRLTGRCSPQEVFQELVRQAGWYPDGTKRPRSTFLSGGWDAVSDRWKPGGLIRRLSPKEREALQHLTADMTQDRLDYGLMDYHKYPIFRPGKEFP